jgi:hypothetical protein
MSIRGRWYKLLTWWWLTRGRRCVSCKDILKAVMYNGRTAARCTNPACGLMWEA